VLVHWPLADHTACVGVYRLQTLREQDKSRITAAEMKFMRKTAKYTWQDDKRYREIMKELKTNPVLEKINN
jgi:hypothetical protein